MSRKLMFCDARLIGRPRNCGIIHHSMSGTSLTEIHKVAILRDGAMGAYFAGQFFNAQFATALWGRTTASPRR